MLDVQRIQRDPRVGYAVSIGDQVATDGDPLAEDDGRPAPAPAHAVSRRRLSS